MKSQIFALFIFCMGVTCLGDFFPSKEEKSVSPFPRGLPIDFPIGEKRYSSIKYPYITGEDKSGDNFTIASGHLSSQHFTRDLVLGKDIKGGFNILEISTNNLRIYQHKQVYNIQVKGNRVTKTLEPQRTYYNLIFFHR